MKRIITLITCIIITSIAFAKDEDLDKGFGLRVTNHSLNDKLAERGIFISKNGLEADLQLLYKKIRVSNSIGVSVSDNITLNTVSYHYGGKIEYEIFNNLYLGVSCTNFHYIGTMNTGEYLVIAPTLHFMKDNYTIELQWGGIAPSQKIPFMLKVGYNLLQARKSKVSSPLVFYY